MRCPLHEYKLRERKSTLFGPLCSTHPQKVRIAEVPWQILFLCCWNLEPNYGDKVISMICAGIYWLCLLSLRFIQPVSTNPTVLLNLLNVMIHQNYCILIPHCSNYT